MTPSLLAVRGPARHARRTRRGVPPRAALADDRVGGLLLEPDAGLDLPRLSHAVRVVLGPVDGLEARLTRMSPPGFRRPSPLADRRVELVLRICGLDAAVRRRSADAVLRAATARLAAALQAQHVRHLPWSPPAETGWRTPDLTVTSVWTRPVQTDGWWAADPGTAPPRGGPPATRAALGWTGSGTGQAGPAAGVGHSRWPPGHSGVPLAVGPTGRERRWHPFGAQGPRRFVVVGALAVAQAAFARVAALGVRLTVVTDRPRLWQDVAAGPVEVVDGVRDWPGTSRAAVPAILVVDADRPPATVAVTAAWTAVVHLCRHPPRGSPFWRDAEVLLAEPALLDDADLRALRGPSASSGAGSRAGRLLTCDAFGSASVWPLGSAIFGG